MKITRQALITPARFYDDESVQPALLSAQSLVRLAFINKNPCPRRTMAFVRRCTRAVHREGGRRHAGPVHREKRSIRLKTRSTFQVQPAGCTFSFHLRHPGVDVIAVDFHRGLKTKVNASSRKFCSHRTQWKNGDTVTLRLPVRVSVQMVGQSRQRQRQLWTPLT